MKSQDSSALTVRLSTSVDTDSYRVDFLPAWRLAAASMGAGAMVTAITLQERQATQAARGVSRVRALTEGWSSTWLQGNRMVWGWVATHLARR